jgi:hypothetical protein
MLSGMGTEPGTFSSVNRRANNWLAKLDVSLLCYLPRVQNIFPAHDAISEPTKYKYQSLSSSLALT